AVHDALPSSIVNVWAFDVPPPGAGLKIVTDADPAAAISAAEMAADSCVAETYVVARSAPFQRTTELVTRFVPVTLSVKPGPPAVAEVGVNPVDVGTGLLAAVIANVCGLDVPPPGAGLKIVTCAVPAAAMPAAAIAAVSCVVEAYVVGRSVPFQRTTE